MPKIYKQNCKECGKYYKGIGKYFCSYICAGKKMGRFMKGKQHNLGNKASEETRKKMSLARKGKSLPKGRIAWNKGKKGVQIAWNKGKKGILLSDFFIRNNPNRKGNKSVNWKGGISKEANYHSRMNKKWAKENPEKIRFYVKARKALKRGAFGTHTLDEWLLLKAFYNYMCLCCKKYEPEIKLTEDHIIPLSKGGSNYIENIQPLCHSCNSKKNIKIINYIDRDHLYLN